MRLLNTRNVREKKFKLFDELTDIWKEVLGAPERSGIWIIYGSEKNGKTWCALMVSVCLSRFEKVLYISGEEGISSHFQNTLNRIGVSDNNKSLYFSDYITMSEIETILGNRRAPRIIVFDNATVYNEELKNGTVRRLQKEHPNTLFIYIAHEEKGEPYMATAKLIKKLAKVILRVQGLACTVSGRCPGGIFNIDDEKAALYYGQLN